MAWCMQIACVVAVVHCCAAFDLDFKSIGPGLMRFVPLGKCASGNKSYIGIVDPVSLVHPKKFFLEIGGGAVCFNKGSCEDSSLRRWTDTKVLLTEFMGMDEPTWNYLTSGTAIPIELMSFTKPGWIPGMAGRDTHPLSGMRGIYAPSCTADIGVGRIDATYTNRRYGNKTVLHHGGMAVRDLLSAVKRITPAIEEFFLYGGSGGGVAAASWMSAVADTFPTAKVFALVDSGFHMMPGTDIFKFFYNHVEWSHGPAEKLARKVHIDPSTNKPFVVPTFDWLDRRSMANTLKKYKGRAKIAYIGCDNDHIVYSDRKLMGKYASAFNDTMIDSQVNEMWKFLTTTHKCAPKGTVASWVASCTTHHLTREMGSEWARNDGKTGNPTIKIKDAISVRSFVYNFLAGKPLDPLDIDRHMFWYDNRTSQMQDIDCGESAAHVNTGPFTERGTTTSTTTVGTGENVANLAVRSGPAAFCAAALWLLMLM